MKRAFVFESLSSPPFIAPRQHVGGGGACTPSTLPPVFQLVVLVSGVSGAAVSPRRVDDDARYLHLKILFAIRTGLIDDVSFTMATPLEKAQRYYASDDVFSDRTRALMTRFIDEMRYTELDAVGVDVYARDYYQRDAPLRPLCEHMQWAYTRHVVRTVIIDGWAIPCASFATLTTTPLYTALVGDMHTTPIDTLVLLPPGPVHDTDDGVLVRLIRTRRVDAIDAVLRWHHSPLHIDRALMTVAPSTQMYPLGEAVATRDTRVISAVLQRAKSIKYGDRRAGHRRRNALQLLMDTAFDVDCARALLQWTNRVPHAIGAQWLQQMDGWTDELKMRVEDLCG